VEVGRVFFVIAAAAAAAVVCAVVIVVITVACLELIYCGILLLHF
jgi:hypothetical protein